MPNTIVTFTKHVRICKSNTVDKLNNGLSALASLMLNTGLLRNSQMNRYYSLDYGTQLYFTDESERTDLDRYLNRQLAEQNIKVHVLKSDPQIFDLNLTGDKLAEIRQNDRNFNLGDVVILNRYDRETKVYSGDVIACRINWVVPKGYGLQPGYCMFGIIRLHGFIHQSHPIWQTSR